MEDLILFITIFVVFFIYFLIDYFIKLKKNKLKNIIGMEIVKAKPKDQKIVGLILTLINSIVISASGTLCTMIEMKKVWQLLYGFVLLTALLYVFYGIIKNNLERKYMKGKKK